MSGLKCLDKPYDLRDIPAIARAGNESLPVKFLVIDEEYALTAAVEGSDQDEPYRQGCNIPCQVSNDWKRNLNPHLLLDTHDPYGWECTLSMDRPSNCTFRALNSSSAFENAINSVVQTGVKSAG